MLNVIHSAMEDDALVEKEHGEAREKVRADMRRTFTFRKPFADSEDDFPENVHPMRPATKPYIPPTMPSDNPLDPFGLSEPPLG
jgi:hypothetical protein